MTWHDFLDPQLISILVAIVVCFVILAVAVTVLRAMWNKTIDLSHLLSESSGALSAAGTREPPKASLSRFQFLVFTFVVAGLYLVLSLETGSLIEVPNGTLVLIGISGATYVAGKAMTDKKPSAEVVATSNPVPAGNAPVPAGNALASATPAAANSAEGAADSAADAAATLLEIRSLLAARPATTPPPPGPV